MNTETTIQTQAVAAAAELALTLPQRAAVALGESTNAAKLRELAAQSAGILTVTNVDGRDEAHRAGMVLRSARTNITATGKAAREDATAFSKAVIAMEKDLIAIVEPEEQRVLALRDAFDEQLAAEKAAKIAVERRRVESIQARITAVRNLLGTVAGMPAAEISQLIYELAGTISQDETHAATFEEFADEYKLARTVALELLGKAEAKQLAVEADARAAEVARLAEIERIAAERAELAEQRAAAARVAAEQAAEAKRLEDVRLKQEADAQRIRLQAEANLKAERDAQAEQMRIERERANAEIKAAQDKLAAEVAEHAAAIKAETDAKAAAEAQQAIDEAERVRLQALTEQATIDAHAPEATLPELLADIEDDDEALTDDEIIELLMETFGMGRAETIARIAAMDLAGAREVAETPP